MRIHLRSRFEIHNFLSNRLTEGTIGSIAFELLHFISLFDKTYCSPKIFEFEKLNSYLSITTVISEGKFSEFSSVFGFFRAGSSRNKSITPIVLRRWPECSPISLTKRVQISSISEKFRDRNPGFQQGKNGFWFLILAKMESSGKTTPNLKF